MWSLAVKPIIHALLVSLLHIGVDFCGMHRICVLRPGFKLQIPAL
jgi:hypothetical protein